MILQTMYAKTVTKNAKIDMEVRQTIELIDLTLLSLPLTTRVKLDSKSTQDSNLSLLQICVLNDVVKALISDFLSEMTETSSMEMDEAPLVKSNLISDDSVVILQQKIPVKVQLVQVANFQQLAAQTI